MKNINRFLILVFLCFFLNSCSSGQSRKNSALSGIKPLEKGKVIPNVICIKDRAFSYSAYLPTGYSEEKIFPIIIAFDPHGNGTLPVEKYKALAEQFGSILIGSNNSKNGQSMDEIQNIIYSLFEEINFRFSLDTNRIYVLGFSGGSRISSLIAMYRGGIKGVIGCGAGFPASDQPARFHFDYIGLAGNADFNMNELINLDGQLEQANFRHALIIFNGKHEWPPVEKMEKAFLWNEFCAMKDGLIPKDIKRIEDYQKKMEIRLQTDDKTSDIEIKRSDLQEMIHFLNGLTPVDKEKEALTQLISSEEFKKSAKKTDLLKKKEMQEQQMFTDNFFMKDMDWWKKRISNIEYRISGSKDTKEILMYKRIMSYLSLLAYMKYSGASSSGAKDKAEFALNVYRIVDPENAAKMK